ncbi:MAG: DUF2325 domain-containing protein [Nitrospina sp.]|jgi:hypothetical protein|nr:DUF2325 domain-containing protein [Nitrospina sp.]MBT3857719.1 DUF2325 domain-containing protein [Nitrospina sp.]MBT4105007.1 DUF2325 domain-containing protein [Nitrospina sp.]MBT4388251.1 DUF2325 domain-containing protein [Nitrospina sp.]MBT4619820.1 DUF2325 domain-containing protein [Nitrospina sp.]
MSVAIVGGLDRLKRLYEKKCVDMGYQGKVFSQRVPNLANRMTGVNAIVIFTGTVAHPMVEEATRVARTWNIPLERSHSSSVSALKRCLEGFSGNGMRA